jgi:hypothetical protein
LTSPLWCEKFGELWIWSLRNSEMF